MTFLEMRKLFRAYTNDIEADRWPDTADVNAAKFVNLGQETIQDVIDDADEDWFMKGFDYPVVPSTDALEFDLPTDYKAAIRAERVVSGDVPIPLDIVKFNKRHEAPPMGWGYGNVYIRGEKIGVVSPTEAWTLWFWYTKRLPDMTVDGESCDIPSQWHKLVVLQGARLAYASEGRDFGVWEGEYQIDMQRLSRFIDRGQRQQPTYINYVEE